ncbi:uncharacterized protein LOC142340988 [Convolutriloba macropyga]|uniref:uncharacterized protein LOC142340988 n=1 Tax=Convolutriloba macropyga TaxID=536237 RepID=UPI003F521C20
MRNLSKALMIFLWGFWILIAISLGIYRTNEFYKKKTSSSPPINECCQSLAFAPDSLYYDVMQQEICISSQLPNNNQSHLQLPKILQGSCQIRNNLTKIEQEVVSCKENQTENCPNTSSCAEDILVAVLLYHNVPDRLDIFLRHFNQLFQLVDDLHLIISTLASDEDAVQ